jgi:polysaccharide export outer membrane protein
MKIFKYGFLVCFTLFLSSCYYNKRLVYLQDKKFSEDKVAVVANKKSTYRVQPHDILSVQIKNSLQDEQSGVFNVTPSENLAMFVTPGTLYIDGYSVDQEGKINLPVIGELVVKDLTIDQIQELIQTHANKYLNKSTVIVKLTIFRITVLGDVRNPGQYFIYNNQSSVLEALGMAGDLNSTGNRKNVKLIRQGPAGSEVVLLDLTNGDLLKSQYFFLMPGDVIYIEPLRARTERSNLDLAALLFSAVTTTILVLTYVKAVE